MGDEVEAGAAAVRAGRAEAGDGAIDDGGVERADIVVGEAHAIDDTGSEVVDHHVGVFEHAAHNGETLLALEVEDDAALVAVEREERRRFAFDEGRAVAPGVVAAVGLFDLDDVCAHVGEEHGAEGTRENLAEVDYLDVLEGQFAVWGLHSHCLRYLCVCYVQVTASLQSSGFPPARE